MNPLLVATAAILFGAATPTVSAAVIAWTTKTISGDSDVSTEGTLLQAVRRGTAATVNGVLFSSVAASTAQTMMFGSGHAALELTCRKGIGKGRALSARVRGHSAD